MNNTNQQSTQNDEDLILVRDKDGKLKYLKGGKLFTKEELEAESDKKIQAEQEKQRKEQEKARKEKEQQETEKNLLRQYVAEQVIDQLKIKFSQPNLQHNFVRTVFERVSNQRSDKEFLYALQLSKQSGGMGLSLDIANKILAVVTTYNFDELKEKFTKLSAEEKNKLRNNYEHPQIYRPAPVKKQESQSLPAAIKMVEPAKKFEPAAPKPAAFEPAASQPIQPAKPMMQPKPEVVTPAKPPAPRPAKMPGTEFKPLAKHEPGAEFATRPTVAPGHHIMPVSRKPMSLPTGKKVAMHDIKYVPVLVGPVDELATLDLVNFRRLGKTEQERIDEIKEKLELLAEDSYVKKIQGIKAWKQSQVYRLYLQIGRDSLMQNKSVSDIIIDRQVKNQETLSIKEFESIMKLNKELEI